jgi:glutathione S-transferase
VRKKGWSQMITLYGVYRSRASRPIWLLTELALDFTHVPVLQAYRLTDGRRAQGWTTASPEFLAVNPLGQIPAYVEDGLVLTESLAITLHIARRHGGDLGPRSMAEAALIDQWTLLAATAVEGPALEILLALESGTQLEGVALNATRLRRPLRRLEQQLEAADWLVGGRFTVADLNMAECLRYAQGDPRLLSEFPVVEAWMKRCQARPAFQAMWARRLQEPD